MKNQDASNISGSATINQAQGDIHYHGMDAGQVYSLCRSVIFDELQNYKDKAAEIAEQRFERAIEMLNNKMESLEKEVKEKLNEPRVQKTLRNSLSECVMTDNEELQEDILDLLIERLTLGTDAMNEYLLDSAIKTLPHLSFQQIGIMITLRLMQYCNFPVSIDFTNKDMVKKYIMSTPYFSRKPTMEYLLQLGCLNANECIIIQNDYSPFTVLYGKLQKICRKMQIRYRFDRIFFPENRRQFGNIFFSNFDFLFPHSLTPLGTIIAERVLRKCCSIEFKYIEDEELFNGIYI